MTFIKSSLVGIGQIFLQENGLSGLIIAVAMFFSHWTLGVGCLLGAIIGTFTAVKLNYPEAQIRQGLYGFNASLAFMCVMFTFALVDADNPIVWALAVVASVVATLLMREFTKRGKVAFTFPFVLTCWIFCWGVAKLGLFGLTQTTPPLAELQNTADAMHSPFYAWAEINFGAEPLTGVLLFLAIAISSPVAAMWGMAAAAMSPMIALRLLDVDHNTLINGIYGFSPILVACAFAGTKLRNFIYVIAGVVLAILIQHYLALTGLATYTIGFIVASWLLLLLKSRVDKAGFDRNKLVKLLNP